MCGPDSTLSRSDLVVSGLGSRRLGASGQDGERRSLSAATLLKDAGSPAAASFDRHSDGSTAATSDATCKDLRASALRVTLPRTVDAVRHNQRARLVSEVILDPKWPCLDQERPPQSS